MAYNNDNLFAQILRGELPAHKVCEDDHCLAFMDIMPQAEGHTLVIPKAPCTHLFDAPVASLQSIIVTTQRVAAAVKQAFSAKGIMIAQLNGTAAGQTVFHLHFHILPRHQGIDLNLHNRAQADHKVLAEHASRIRAALAEH